MAVTRLAWLGPAALLLLVLVPVAGATTPLHGTITTCSSNWSCDFVFNTSAGSGWANGTSSGYLHAGSMTLRLPAEAKTSTGLTYWTYIQRLTGTYTYWTIGNFMGTDVNTGKVVYGTTDSNYTITCHGHSGRGGGCTYTYTVDNGTIVVHFTQAEQTSTSISCSPTSINVAGKTTCTVTVTNLWNPSYVPTGKVHITASVGSLSNKGSCLLSSGQCTFTFHPSDNACGSATIYAAYLGTSAFYKSNGYTTVGVTGGC